MSPPRPTVNRIQISQDLCAKSESTAHNQDFKTLEASGKKQVIIGRACLRFEGEDALHYVSHYAFHPPQ